MEGEDQDKPVQDEQNEEEESPPSLPEEYQINTTPSSIPLSKTTTQSTPVASSLFQPVPINSDVKSNSVFRSLGPKASPSERSMISAIPKASSRKIVTNIFNETEEYTGVMKPQPNVGKSPGGERVNGSTPGLGGFPVPFLNKRSPFIHNPPHPEERRARIQCPRTPREYIINLREDLADFQESHGLPRTRDYSFVSLGLALAQETVRAIYSVFLVFTELFPILAIVSLILRFALDKIIDILETPEPVPKIKKAVIFGLEMLVIVIPLWILIGTIVLPLVSLIFSIFKKVLWFKGGKKKSLGKSKLKPKTEICGFFL